MANLAILICEELGSLLQDDDNQFDRRQGVPVKNWAYQICFVLDTGYKANLKKNLLIIFIKIIESQFFA